MTVEQRRFWVCLGIFSYLVLGWHIGKIKHDLWYGLNGRASLARYENSKNETKTFLREFFFPLAHEHFYNTLQGISSRENRGKMFVDAGFNERNPSFYKTMHALAGLPFSFIWFLVIKVSRVIFMVFFGIFTILLSIFLSIFS